MTIIIIRYVSLPTEAQQGQRINWLEVCEMWPIDAIITEPFHTVITSYGYTLTTEGERVLGCIGGGTLAELAGIPELLTLKDTVSCGGGTSISSSSNDDPLGNIISGLLG